MRAAVDIIRRARLAEVHLMTASEFYGDEVWRDLLSMRENAALEAALRGELLEAVRRTGRPFRAEPVVLQLLHEAPRHSDIQEVAASALGRAHVKAETERKALWKLL